MKKISYIIIVLLAFVIVGCGDDPRPKEWDVKLDNKWIICAKGELLDINIRDYTDYEDDYVFKFHNKNILVGQIKNIEQIRSGQIGSLYRYKSGSGDEWAWFQWIEEKTIIKSIISNNIETKQIEINNKLVEEKKNIVKEEIKFIEYRWKEANLYKPDLYENVLVELNDGIITVAYMNNSKKWKLSFYRNKINGGRTINNIVKWKEINID